MKIGIFTILYLAKMNENGKNIYQNTHKFFTIKILFFLNTFPKTFCQGSLSKQHISCTCTAIT